MSDKYQLLQSAVVLVCTVYFSLGSSVCLLFWITTKFFMCFSLYLYFVYLSMIMMVGAWPVFQEVRVLVEDFTGHSQYWSFCMFMYLQLAQSNFDGNDFILVFP